jgi:hypothetical protein
VSLDLHILVGVAQLQPSALVSQLRDSLISQLRSQESKEIAQLLLSDPAARNPEKMRKYAADLRRISQLAGREQITTSLPGPRG